MSGTRLVVGQWTKSSFSFEPNQCVEVCPLASGGMAVRDSKNPAGAALSYTAEEWSAFIKGAKDGQFDL